MLLLNVSYDNKLIKNLFFRSFFDSFNYFLFFNFVESGSLSTENLKLKLIKLNLEYRFINNLYLPNLSPYLNFLYSKFFVIKVSKLDFISNLIDDNLYLVGCLYKNYLLNNSYFIKILFYYNFYNYNFLFIINFLKYFVNSIFYFLSVILKLILKCQLLINFVILKKQ